MARALERLPGVRFDAQAPVVESLPRMDIPVFVGFASEGPLNVPVAIESPQRFTEVFGVDPSLGRDPDVGPVLAQLGGCVRAFFANGGRRAWVIRVAGAAAAPSRFLVPGLLGRTAEGAIPAVVVARASGSYADDLRVSAVLLSSLLDERVLDPGFALRDELELGVDPNDHLEAGDLLRFSFPGSRLACLRGVESVSLPGPAEMQGSGSAQTSRIRAKVRLTSTHWLRNGPPDVLEPMVEARIFDERLERRALLHAPPTWQGDSLTLRLILPFADAPSLGAFVVVRLQAAELWLCASEVRLVPPVSNAEPSLVEVSGTAQTLLDIDPAGAELQGLAGAAARIERLRLELWARRGEEPAQRMGDLGFEAAHARFWAALPTDEQLYRRRFVDPRHEQDDAAMPQRHDGLYREASLPRFAVAGSGPPAAPFYLPLGMPFVAEAFLGRSSSGGSAAVRDGLERFDAQIFLDPSLSDTPVAGLLAQADFLRYRQEPAHALRGLHAALEVEEATMIAVPDAAHRHWSSQLAPPEAVTAAPLPPAEVSSAEFSDCRKPLQIPALLAVQPDATGSFTLAWTGALEPAQRYRVEQSARGDDASWSGIYVGQEPRVPVFNRPAGNSFYRVRIEGAVVAGAWSSSLLVTVPQLGLPDLEAADDYTGADLLQIQRALLRLCAARGDLVALLALPEHYRENHALAHAALLTRPALGDDVAPLNYGALYHPWLGVRDERLDSRVVVVRNLSPEGAVAGSWARRTLTRGAWLAPANEILRRVLAITPPVARAARLALQTAQLNLIREEPAGFMVLSESTLSADPELRPIHVRRLLILLRRAALRLGANYAFEPNDASLRRLVQRGFEAMLTSLHSSGAFAGASPNSAFQVITDVASGAAGPNEARLSVDLRVAPAVPLNFLTLRLVQSGAQTQVSELR